MMKSCTSGGKTPNKEKNNTWWSESQLMGLMRNMSGCKKGVPERESLSDVKLGRSLPDCVDA